MQTNTTLVTLVLISFLATGRAMALPPDAADRTRKLLPGAQVKDLPAGDWTVHEPDEQPFIASTKPSAPHKIHATGAIDFNGKVLLEDRDGGKCYWGTKERDGELKTQREFASFDEFLTANSFVPLPKPPHGFAVRQLALMPVNCTRLTSDPTRNRLYVLAQSGDVYQIDLPDGEPALVISHDSYGGKEQKDTFGFTLTPPGPDQRMYIVANSYDHDAHPAMNHVTIYRSTSLSANDGVPTGLKPWFKTDIPFAIDVFQHGVSGIAQGPDGFIYVSSGSRTDHGERGEKEPNRYHEGEVPASSCIWRLDPRSDSPKLEIFARGIRNAFGFCFDDRGRMFATENGPNADPPEEVNLIERGQDYGFPYHFSDWDHPAYADQPKPPSPDYHDRLPIQNVGPAGGTKEKPISTLDPHSSPSGIVFIRPDDGHFPSSCRGTFLIARFGNLIPLKQDAGFDVVQMRLIGESGGRLRAEVTPFLSPVSRPTDIHLARSGKIYLCEYQRQTRNGGGDLPGRILEVSVSAPEGTSAGSK